MASQSDVVLTRAQEQAIAVVRARAVAKRAAAIESIHHVLRMANIIPPDRALDDVRDAIQSSARIVVHFHPDRPVDSTRTVSRALCEEGTYKNQFETGISNGGVSAFAGGARDEWERALFAGSYHGDEIAAADRPKYGALDLVGASDGPAPRFGCCYFVLKPHVAARATLTFGGSQDAPAHVGTVDELDDVLAALFAECFVRDAALGMPNLRAAGLIERINRRAPTGDRTQRPSGNLDFYIEAQVHGPLQLARDVEAVVVDPSFRGSPTWADLEAMSAAYAFPVYTHPGFRLAVSDVPLDFRGPAMRSLATRICRPFESFVDARAIGAAVCSLRENSDAWADRGTPAEVLQELKLLWHVLLRFGHPHLAILQH